jgi:Tfp pilus assembly protein PilV
MKSRFRIIDKKGFSVIEVILAVTLFMFLATGVILAVLQGLDSNRLGEEQTVASQYASEGIEAVRSIKNQNFANLVNSTGTGIQRVSNVWTFSGANNILNSKYTRVIQVDEVRRDCSTNSIVTSGGVIDPMTKKITSTVSWNFTPTRSNSVQLVSYLTDWKKSVDNIGEFPPMMAYSKSTTTPFIRTWDGSSWSAESQARVAGGSINYLVLKRAKTRNEAILATVGSNGFLYVQVWNGRCWTATVLAGLGSEAGQFRSVDIEYEKNTDRAIVTYLGTQNGVNPTYRIWDGSSWSAPVEITSPPTTGAVRWIEMAQNPLSASNEIAMIMSDANLETYGMIWNGTSWDTMGVSSSWDTTTSVTPRKIVDVAYEQNSGRAMFIWSDRVAQDHYYRIWDGNVLGPSTLLKITDIGGFGNWVQLAPRPDSNEIMFGIQDAGRDLNTRKWSGSAWDTATQHPEHDPDVEIIASKNFDIVWETIPSNSGKAWLMWGDGSTVSKKQWSSTTNSWGEASALPDSDDTAFIKLKADPTTGTIFAGLYEDSSSSTDDILETRLTGGGTSWTVKNTIWAGPTSAGAAFFRIDIATP